MRSQKSTIVYQQQLGVNSGIAVGQSRQSIGQSRQSIN